jgi:hypothetical protein
MKQLYFNPLNSTTMRTTKKSILKGLAIAAVCFTLACENKKNNEETVALSKKEEVKPVVQSPFKNVDVAYDKFTVQPNSDVTLTAPSGSKIHIASNSLKDTAGNSINEPVEISYREFMNPSEIMASGIPMMFTDQVAGIKKPFQSAGMFEILAETKSGKKVVVNNESPINVELATNITDAGYSNFYLNTSTGEWVYSGEETKKENRLKVDINNQLKKLKNVSGFLGKDFFVLDGAELLDKYLNDDYDKIYKHKFDKKPLPNGLLKYGMKAMSVYSYDMVKLNRLDVPASLVIWENINHTEFPKWIKEKVVTVKNIDGNNYELTISDGKKKPTIFKTKAKAVMTIKSMFKFEPEMWSKNYDEALDEIKKQEDAVATMNDVFRTLQVNAFGVYNCDRFYSNPESFTVKVNCVMPESKNGFVPENIYYVSTKDRLTINFKLTNEILMTLCNDKTAALYTVLEDNMLAVVSAEELSKYNKQTHANSSIKINFKPKAKINSVDDIKKQIGI